MTYQSLADSCERRASATCFASFGLTTYIPKPSGDEDLAPALLTDDGVRRAIGVTSLELATLTEMPRALVSMMSSVDGRLPAPFLSPRTAFNAEPTTFERPIVDAGSGPGGERQSLRKVRQQRRRWPLPRETPDSPGLPYGENLETGDAFDPALQASSSIIIGGEQKQASTTDDVRRACEPLRARPAPDARRRKALCHPSHGPTSKACAEAQ